MVQTKPSFEARQKRRPTLVCAWIRLTLTAQAARGSSHEPLTEVSSVNFALERPTRLKATADPCTDARPRAVSLLAPRQGCPVANNIVAAATESTTLGRYRVVFGREGDGTVWSHARHSLFPTISSIRPTNALRGNRLRNAAPARSASVERPRPSNDLTRKASRSSVRTPRGYKRRCSAMIESAEEYSPRATACRAGCKSRSSAAKASPFVVVAACSGCICRLAREL